MRWAVFRVEEQDSQRYYPAFPRDSTLGASSSANSRDHQLEVERINRKALHIRTESLRDRLRILVTCAFKFFYLLATMAVGLQ